MFSNTKLAQVLLVLAICGLVCGNGSSTAEENDAAETRATSTTQATTRTGRVLNHGRMVPPPPPHMSHNRPYAQQRSPLPPRPPQPPTFSLRRRIPPNNLRIRSRADHFPIRYQQIRRAYNDLGNGGAGGRFGADNFGPNSGRYGYEALKSSKYIPSKNANIPFGKGAARPNFQHSHGKPDLGINSNLNTLQTSDLSQQQYQENFKASPAFNGKVVVHPVTKLQQLPNQSARDTIYGQSGKSPQQPNQYQQQSPSYSDFEQFPIPDQKKMQKFNQQHEYYLQQQKYLAPRDQYYQQDQQQHQQQQQQQHQPHSAQQQYQKPSQNYAARPLPSAIPIHEVNNEPESSQAPPQKMYSVYEENDMTALQNTNYQTMEYEALDAEAKEYLKFMNSHEYFLPKRDPNYRQIDEETDRRQRHQVQQQQQQQQRNSQYNPSPYEQVSKQYPVDPNPPQAPVHNPVVEKQYSLQQIQSQQYPPQHIKTPYEQQQYKQDTLYQQAQQYLQAQAQIHKPDLSFNQPAQVAKLYYQEDPKTGQAATSTVVRTSYQTGGGSFNQQGVPKNSNEFLVSADGKKGSKYILPTPSSIDLPQALASTKLASYSSSKNANYANDIQQRTVEPLRFEFTERDAMITDGTNSYTNAPKTVQLRNNDNGYGQKLSYETVTAASSSSNQQPSLRIENGYSKVSKPFVESQDDEEDGDDMQEAGSNIYGRQPVNSETANKNIISSSSAEAVALALSTTESVPTEQKDTEDYCERICAIVEDENEEIVCGSDGYMYTSEAQMECYASCLHIDVTIQGKGSCSAR